MGDMPGHVTKGPLLFYLDRISRESNAKQKLEALLLELRNILPHVHNPSSPYNLATTLKTHLYDAYGDYDQAQEATDHLAKDWLAHNGIENAMWHLYQPIEPIFCQGLITTLEEAIYQGQSPGSEPAKSLVINSHWVCAGFVYELVISRSFDQVSLLILTPPPERRNSGLKAPPEQKKRAKLSVVKRRFLTAEELKTGRADEGTIEQLKEDPGRGAKSSLIVLRMAGAPALSST
jgi:hypothetical protein